MNSIVHNIKREIDFLNLFGFSVIETKNTNMWNIVDKNNKRIGYILYKELKKDNEILEFKENDNSRKFDYQMVFDTDDIHYNESRKITDVNKSHFFVIKTKKYGNVNIYLNFGDELSLIMYSNEDEQEKNGEYIN